MPAKTKSAHHQSAGNILVAAGGKSAATPIWLGTEAAKWAGPAPSPLHLAWLKSQNFKANGRKLALLPGADGTLAGVAFGAGEANAADPMSKPEVQLGLLPQQLPPGTYTLAGTVADPELASVAWGLGAYRFRRYKSGEADAIPRLELPASVDPAITAGIIDGVWLGRDLINTPASDMGPDELETAARTLAKRHGAKVTSIVGDDLLVKNFPMIHAVGRASPRPPRIIDLTWGPESAPRITLVGKGICFDTGGLDLKPSSGMLLMKKDMGGAATALALGHMIMTAKLKINLRILIAAAENSVAGNAFRPGDVLMSRAGKTVEIGNTDAEGRLVLADALALADEAKPGTIITFATLTGAARVALGPDLPPLFTGDDAFASDIAAAGHRVGDPVWRLPFWPGYEANIDSPIADMNNVSEAPFAGAIIGALFLQRFVKSARRFAHFDIYGWRPTAKPLGPKGGEPQVARALFDLFRRQHAS